MKVGRNDECHCGSGKKYKKCCLAADQVAEQSKPANLLLRSNDARDNAAVDSAFVETHGFGKVRSNALSVPSPKPADPKMDAINARWKEFEEATEVVRRELYIKTLDDPELMDDEMAFEMLNRLYQSTINSDERDVWDNLIEQLRERFPDVYAESRNYYLGMRIKNLIAGGRRERVKALVPEIAEIAERDVDLYARIVDQLAYHGMLDELSEISHIAWLDIRDSDDILWGQNTFADWGADCVLFERLEKADELSDDDQELIQAVSYYFEDLQLEHFFEYIKSMSGQSDRVFSLSDFKTEIGPQRSDRYDDDDKLSLTSDSRSDLSSLLNSFVSYARRVEGVPYPKAKLACSNIYSYICDRSAGRLEPRQSPMELIVNPRKKTTPKPKPKPPKNVLCPDFNTLDRYLAQHLHFMNPLQHQVAATFELMPAWLRFLESKGLLESELHATALKELGKLQATLCKLFQSDRSDPALFENLSSWHGAAESTTVEVE